MCGINPPADKSYCGNYLSLNRTHRCVYCREQTTGNHYCLIRVNNKTIEGFDCEDGKHTIVNEDLPGSPCFNHQEIRKVPMDQIDFNFCHNHSTDATHPCCLYDDGITKKCFSIGKITSETLYTYNDFLQCNMKYIKINILLSLSLLFIYIF